MFALLGRLPQTGFTLSRAFMFSLLGRLPLARFGPRARMLPSTRSLMLGSLMRAFPLRNRF
jgi:hypothetical protein